MDYLTRKSIARTGTSRGWLFPKHHPHLGAIGVRVSGANGLWTVSRRELAEAVSDLALTLDLAADEILDADKVETQFVSLGYLPAELHTRALGFLRSLAENDLMLASAAQMGSLLDAEEQRFAAILRRATTVLGSEPAALAWMHTPQLAFGDKKPIELLGDDAGVEAVLHALRAIEDGGYL